MVIATPHRFCQKREMPINGAFILGQVLRAAHLPGPAPTRVVLAVESAVVLDLMARTNETASWYA
jgi:hypothetical protein